MLKFAKVLSEKRGVEKGIWFGKEERKGAKGKTVQVKKRKTTVFRRKIEGDSVKAILEGGIQKITRGQGKTVL